MKIRFNESNKKHKGFPMKESASGEYSNKLYELVDEMKKDRLYDMCYALIRWLTEDDCEEFYKIYYSYEDELDEGKKYKKFPMKEARYIPTEDDLEDNTFDDENPWEDERERWLGKRYWEKSLDDPVSPEDTDDMVLSKYRQYFRGKKKYHDAYDRFYEWTTEQNNSGRRMSAMVAFGEPGEKEFDDALELYLSEHPEESKDDILLGKEVDTKMSEYSDIYKDIWNVRPHSYFD